MTESSRSKTLEVIGKALAVAESVSYLKYRDLFDEQAGDILTALQAEGMAVVPVEATSEMLEDGASAVAKADSLPPQIASYEATAAFAWAAMLSASPYGKAVVKEKDDG